jgi:ABC-type multidrug transport system fused ATPase/permease subunit
MITDKSKFIWRYLLPYKFSLISGFICGLIKSVCVVLMPLLISYIVDEVFYYRRRPALFVYSTTYTVIFIGYLIILLLSTYTWIYLENKFVVDLKTSVVEKMLKIPYKAAQEYSLGDFDTLVNRDTTQFLNEVENNYINVYRFIFSLLLSEYLIFRMNHMIAVFLFAALLISVITNEYISRVIKRESTALRSDINHHISLLVSYIHGRTSLRLNSYLRGASRRIMSSTAKYIRQDTQCAKFSLLNFTLNQVVFTCIEGFIFLYAAKYIINGSMTVGQFVGVLAYIEIIKSDMGWLLDNYVDTKKRAISIEKVIAHLTMGHDIPISNELDKSAGPFIEFKKVSFSYCTDEQLLHDLDFSIESGDKVGLVGLNGTGKSTILNLLLGLYKPDSGRIIFREASELKFGVIPQDVYLFTGSIRYNLILNQTEIDDELIHRIFNLVNLSDVIAKLPSGLDTMVSQDTKLLTKSEIQKLMIARILLMNPHVLVIDEATSFLDDKYEEEITDIINETFKEKTVIIVSHKMKSLRHCNKILELSREGKLISKLNC